MKKSLKWFLIILAGVAVAAAVAYFVVRYLKDQEEEEFDDFILDDMEDLLIKADLGVSLASSITLSSSSMTSISLTKSSLLCWIFALSKSLIVAASFQ